MLVHTDPLRDLAQLTRLLDGNPANAAMDAYRVGDVINVEFDLPGVDPSTVDLQIERGELRLSARRTSTAPEGARYLVRERAASTVTRRVVLGDVLDVDHVDAEYTDGVLHLRIPLRDTAKPKQIAILRPSDADRRAIEVETA